MSALINLDASAHGVVVDAAGTAQVTAGITVVRDAVAETGSAVGELGSVSSDMSRQDKALRTEIKHFVNNLRAT